MSTPEKWVVMQFRKKHPGCCGASGVLDSNCAGTEGEGTEEPFMIMTARQ